jgi:hypothetical protein
VKDRENHSPIDVASKTSTMATFLQDHLCRIRNHRFTTQELREYRRYWLKQTWRKIDVSYAPIWRYVAKKTVLRYQALLDDVSHTAKHHLEDGENEVRAKTRYDEASKFLVSAGILQHNKNRRWQSEPKFVESSEGMHALKGQLYIQVRKRRHQISRMCERDEHLLRRHKLRSIKEKIQERELHRDDHSDDNETDKFRVHSTTDLFCEYVDNDVDEEKKQNDEDEDDSEEEDEDEEDEEEDEEEEDSEEEEEEEENNNEELEEEENSEDEEKNDNVVAEVNKGVKSSSSSQQNDEKSDNDDSKENSNDSDLEDEEEIEFDLHHFNSDPIIVTVHHNLVKQHVEQTNSSDIATRLLVLQDWKRERAWCNSFYHPNSDKTKWPQGYKRLLLFWETETKNATSQAEELNRERMREEMELREMQTKVVPLRQACETSKQRWDDAEEYAREAFQKIEDTRETWLTNDRGLRSEIERARSAVQELTNERDLSNKNIVSLQKKRETMSENIFKLTSEIKKLNQEIKDSKKNKNKKKRNKTRRRSISDDDDDDPRKMELKKMKRKLQHVQNELSNVSASFVSAEESIRFAETQISTKEKDILNLEEERKRIKSEFQDELRECMKAYESVLDKVQNRKHVYRNDARSLVEYAQRVRLYLF